LIGSLLALIVLLVSGSAIATENTLTIRVVWGGGQAQQWLGSVQLEKGRVLRMEALGVEADEPGSMWIWDDALFVRQRSLRTFDGVDLTVQADPADVLVLDLRPNEDGARGKRIQVPLTTLISAHHQEALDEKGNRLLVSRGAGGGLELVVRRLSLVFAPRETLDVTLRPNLLPVANGTAIKVTAQLQRIGDAEPAWSDRQQLVWNDGAQPAPEFPYKIALPQAEGVYELSVEATADSLASRLWNKGALASRKMQMVVVHDRRSAAEPLSWTTDLEIDPTHHSWWQRVADVPIPWVKDGLWPKVAGAADSENAATRMHPLGRLAQLPTADAAGKTSWAVYPLAIARPGEPHLLEVDYPSDVPQTLLVSVVETDASGQVIALGLDSGVYLPGEARDRRPEWLQHRVVFWPRTQSAAVLLANPATDRPAAFGKLRVKSGAGGAGRLPPAMPPDQAASRIALAYLEKPLLGKTFTATEEYDAWSGRTFETWSTFYEGGTRLVEYLHYAGYSGAIVGVACDGAAIYPSDVLQPTPRYDGGVFLIAGHDPVRKDVLELLLRLFDREGLQFVPAIDFSAPLPELEEIIRRGGPGAVGIQWVGSDGRTLLESHGAFGGSAPYYNVLHPSVQAAMARAVRELVWRCADHPSFAGLALQLSAQGYCQLPGVEWGFDDATIAQFERDTQVRVPFQGEARFVQRAKLLLGEQRATWLAWRAAMLRRFYLALWTEAAKANPAARLHLCTGRLFDSPQWNARLRPTLSGVEPGQGLLLELGLDETLLADTPQVVFYRPTLSAPLRSVGQQATQLEVEHAAWLDRAGLGKHVRAAMIYHVPQEVNLQARSAGGELASGGAWLVSQPLPSDAAARKALAHALALQDAGLLAAGGWQLPRGQEDATREFLSVFRQLPAGEFRTLEGQTQPVVFRAMSWKGATYVYLVNDSPWRVTARVRINGAPQLVLSRLSAAGPVAVPLRNDGQGSVWEVDLSPYELAAGFVSVPAAAVNDPQVELDPAVAAELTARINDLTQTVANLRDPKPRGGPPNADFEEPRRAQVAVPQWELLPAQGTSAQLDAREKAVGKHSVRLTSDGPTAVLLSQPFAPPRTGRLAVRVRARPLDASRPPLLRLVLEGDYRGHAYVRHAVIGQGPARFEDRWQQYDFALQDLPFESLSPLRLRFELIGPGVVWLDDVQTFDALFGSKTELIELSKIITWAGIKLQRGQLGDCQRILESYWPRYLAAYAAPSAEPPTAEANAASAPEIQPPAPPGASAPQSSAPAPSNQPGFLDRMKGYLPDFMRR
jgi:hypothetical protein